MLNEKTPISLHEAARRGIMRLKPISEHYNYISYIEIDLINGAVGPWVRAYYINPHDNQPDEKHDTLLIDLLQNKESYFDDKCFIPYGG